VIVGVSERLPPLAFVAHPSVPRATRSRIRQAVLAPGGERTVGYGLGLSAELATFGAVADADYDILRDLE